MQFDTPCNRNLQRVFADNARGIAASDRREPEDVAVGRRRGRGVNVFEDGGSSVFVDSNNELGARRR